MKMLDNATLEGKQKHTKHVEKVSLPDGVRAVFKGNAQSRVLEIMQRTGSHVQMESYSTREQTLTFEDGFGALQLWGLPEENAHAIRLLPEMVSIVTKDVTEEAPTLRGDELRSEVTDRYGTPPADEETDGMDSAYWEDGDPFDRELGDAIDDLVYAPAKGPVPLHATWTRKRPHNPNTATARDHEQPRVWTALSFTAHVDDLTASVPRLARIKDSRQGTSTAQRDRIVTAIEELQGIFLHDDLTEHVTSDSVDKALRFLVQHRAGHVIQNIFRKLESGTSSGYKFTASNFDILLASAAKEEDVHNFRYTLRLMIQRDISPTWQTWVRFHDLVTRRFAARSGPRDQVETKMREKGILANPAALRAIIANAVEVDLRRYFNTLGRYLEGFFRFYDHKFADFERPKHIADVVAYPRAWLTTSTANRMAKSLLTLGRLDDASTVVTRLLEAGEKVSTATVNTFLTSAHANRNMEQAVATLRFFRPHFPVEQGGRHNRSNVLLDETSYGILFRIAWHKKQYNVLRIVWRYACLGGHVGWHMQRRMQESLISYVPAHGPHVRRVEKDAQALTSSDVWFGWAAKFAVGIAKGSHENSDESNGSAGGIALPYRNEDNPDLRVAPQDRVDRNESLATPALHTADSGGDASSTTSATPAAAPSTATSNSIANHQQAILTLSTQPRTTRIEVTDNNADPSAASQVHANRKRTLQQIFYADLKAVTKCQPTVSFIDAMEAAWRKDKEWQSRRLGQINRDLIEAAKTGDLRAFGEHFGEMLDDGVDVPVRGWQKSRPPGGEASVAA